MGKNNSSPCGIKSPRVQRRTPREGREEILREYDAKTAVLNAWHERYDSVVLEHYVFESEYSKLASVDEVAQALFNLLSAKAEELYYYREMLVALAGVMAELKAGSGKYRFRSTEVKVLATICPEIRGHAILHSAEWLVGELQKKRSTTKQKYFVENLVAWLQSRLIEFSQVHL